MSKRKITMSIAYNYWTSARRHSKQIEISKQEWIEWWKETGHWEERGNGREQYGMFRLDKTKPFTLDNIICDQQKNKRRYY